MVIMKFESYLDKYYEEVDGIEFSKFIPIKMDDKEVETIKNKCSLPLTHRIIQKYDYLTHEKKKTDQVSDQVIKFDRTDVYKAEDEYYYVRISNYDWDRQIDQTTFYRCDQIEGLIQLFRDKKIYKS
jgi:chaperone required for assembly of F1-ATPase